MYAYQKSGMGWSDLPSYPTCSTITGGGIKRCFTASSGDVSCAQSCGCRTMNEVCRTTSGYNGTAYCCPRDCPTPEHGCQPFTRNLICDLDRVELSTLRDATTIAVWNVKNRLCAQRIDAGAVNGAIDNRLAEALRTFQARSGLPQTGAADQQTLYRLGFNANDAARYSAAIIGATTPTSQQIQPLQLPWGLIAASSAASIFMIFAVWKFARAKR